MNRLSTMLAHRRIVASPTHSQLAYFSRTTSIREKVQTPVQSQNKDDVAPELRPAEGTTVQTPVQSQYPWLVTANSTTGNARPKRDLLPLYTLFGGLALGSVFVYFYYHQRKAHMQSKWDKMVKEAQEARKGGG